MLIDRVSLTAHVWGPAPQIFAVSANATTLARSIHSVVWQPGRENAGKTTPIRVPLTGYTQRSPWRTGSLDVAGILMTWPSS